jgi:hypothetical protein
MIVVKNWFCVISFTCAGMTVLTVIATDPDNGNNGSVSYSLKQVPMKGNQPLFSIDSHMGLISTMQNNALDRETQSEYYIIVQAKDRGSPPMSGGYYPLAECNVFRRFLTFDSEHVKVTPVESWAVFRFAQTFTALYASQFSAKLCHYHHGSDNDYLRIPCNIVGCLTATGRKSSLVIALMVRISARNSLFVLFRACRC